MESSIREFVLSIPLVTRALFLGTLAVTIAANWGLVSPLYLVLNERVYLQLQLWRMVTSVLFAGMLSFQFLMSLFMMYTYSKSLEQEQFTGRTADYIVFVVFGIVGLSAIGLVRGTPILNFELTMVIIYLWSQLNKDRIVTFYFGTRFPAKYLPYVMAAFQALIGGTLEPSITGIAVGHLYYLLEYDLPTRNNGVHYLQAPAFLLNWFPAVAVHGGFGPTPMVRAVAPPGRADAAAPAAAPGSSSYPWRGGQRLGGAD